AVVDQLRTLGVAGPSPGIKRSPLELRREQWLTGRTCARHIRRGFPNGRVRAVETLRVIIPPADRHCPSSVHTRAIVIADKGHRDAVSSSFGLEMLHISAAVV